MTAAPTAPAAPETGTESGTGTRRWADLDDVQQERMRLLVVDALGLAAAGTASTEGRQALAGAALLGAVGAGDEAAGVRVPWTDRRLAATQAALATATLIHTWDFDDTHDEAVVHTASVVVPAALAAVATAPRPVDGEAFLDGIVTGVHVLARLARLTGPRRGVIRTAGLGSAAAAATAATVWGLDDAATESAMALSLTTSLAPGTRQAVVDSSVAKRVQPGLAAQGGLSAAALAAAGLVGPAGWLGGDYGLVPGSGLGIDDVWGGSHEVDQLALKPYPACRYGHAAIAAGEAAQRQVPDLADVERIVVHLPAGESYLLVSRPYADRGEPIIDAQFSVPWQLAALWVTGRYDLTTLTTDLGRADVAAAAGTVEVRQDLPASTVMSGATVEVLTTDGRTIATESPMPGSPENPLSRDDVDRKLRSCLAVAGLDDAAAETAAGAVWSLVADLPGLDAAALAVRLDAATPAA